MKERLDILLVNKGLAPSREKAKAMIMEGNVFVDNNREDKAGSTFDVNANIEVKGNTLKYVSRGGLKLEKAMTHFGITLEGKVCMDIGASTGGFTDCMLQDLRLNFPVDPRRSATLSYLLLPVQCLHLRLWWSFQRHLSGLLRI